MFVVFDGYEHMTDSSPYSVNGGGLSPATAFSHSRLEVSNRVMGFLLLMTLFNYEAFCVGCNVLDM